MTNQGSAPLEGIRVIDITQSAAGPYCTMILGDLGADVIKIERPEFGDDARSWAPPYWGEYGCTFLALNRNKRSLAVDLKAPEGREVLRELATTADVLVQNFRANSLDSLGLGWRDLSALNDRLIYCSMTAFGSTGPRAAMPGYDPLAQAYGGLMSLTGAVAVDGGQPPTPVRVGTSINDMGMGMWGAIGILSALMERQQTNRGRLVETSLFETAVAWIPYQIQAYLGGGDVPGPQGSGTAMNAPYEAFPTKDGNLMIAAGNQKLWLILCDTIGLPALVYDPRFLDNPARVRNRPALFEVLAERLRLETSDHWEQLLTDVGVPCSPIRTLDQVTADPQLAALGLIRDVAHPRIPGYQDVGLPLSWDGERTPVRMVPPDLGAHTIDVLLEAGFTEERIQTLTDTGVVAGSRVADLEDRPR